MLRFTQVLTILTGAVAFVAMAPLVVNAPNAGAGTAALIVCTVIATASVLITSSINDRIKER